MISILKITSIIDEFDYENIITSQNNDYSQHYILNLINKVYGYLKHCLCALFKLKSI